MKKLTRRGFTAAGILAALGAGVSFLPGCNLIGCVYGPPPEDLDPEQNEAAGMYGPPLTDEEVYGISPKDNESVSVYGPPAVDDDPYDPMENVTPAVYGPPADDELANTTDTNNAG